MNVSIRACHSGGSGGRGQSINYQDGGASGIMLLQMGSDLQRLSSCFVAPGWLFSHPLPLPPAPSASSILASFLFALPFFPFLLPTEKSLCLLHCSPTRGGASLLPCLLACLFAACLISCHTSYIKPLQRVRQNEFFNGLLKC